ncbi:MAG: DNA polymerase III subunit alpha [Candidatus Marinimicrobia bacterium]|nr:DNA polymerase III subunit alpha [Candidatus Neomarinimicrobiota bacterium]
MQGTAPLEALIDRAKALGMSHLALTEVNGLWSLVNFTRLARQAGIQAICGSHILTGDTGNRPDQDLVLLIGSQAGYENLCRILSRLHDEPALDILPALETWGRGLVVLCPDPALLSQLAKVIPGENLYGELRPHADTMPVLTSCRELGIHAVATGEVYFLEPDDVTLYRLLRAMDRNQRLSDLPGWERKSEGHSFAGEEEIRRRYPHCPEVVDRTVEIAARCRTGWDFSTTIFPSAGTGIDANARLREWVYAGADRRYGTPLAPQVRDRIELELGLVCDRGFAPYFLIVADIVKESSLTIGRGSAAASILSYCLLITQVDPIRHHLAFERFLHPERTDLPDIDVDFAWDERDAILDYVFQKYGTDHVAMVANHVTLQPRAAVREVAKVYGLSSEEIITVTKRIHLVFAEAGHPNQEVIDPLRQEPPSLSAAAPASDHPLHMDDTLEEVIRLAMRLIGVFHYPSVHPGGVVVVPDDIRKYVPVLKAPKGVQIVEWEKDQVEDSGLVKIDLLGNRSLAVVRDCLRDVNLYRLPEEHLSYHDLQPFEDGQTASLMERGRTMGVFYVESPATRQLLAKAGRADYEHVVIYSSIIRPAANRYCNLLIERIRGAPWQPLHPRLDFLNESYGIMVYQEQVALGARVMAGFPWAEADLLQKIGTKKSLRPLIPAFREKFITQSIKRGYPQEVVRQVWDMIESFRGYSFTKAHSASYARLSFVCAYLKAHFPAEFMAAVISNRGGYYSPYAYMSEARRLGIRVLPPHINRSPLKWKGHRGKIRVGLMEIRQLQKNSIRAVLEGRKRDDFASLEDFLGRVDIPFADVRTLVRAGCFDDLEPDHSRPDMLLQVMEHYAETHETGSVLAAPATPTGPAHIPLRPALRALTRRQRFDLEVESFGYPLTWHPLAPFGAILKGRTIRAVDLPGHVGRTVRLAGVCLTTKTVKTRRGQPMEFLTFEDQTDVFECVLFPDQYQRFNDLARWEKLFLIRGKVEGAWDVYTVTIEELTSLNQLMRGWVKRSSPGVGTEGTIKRVPGGMR